MNQPEAGPLYQRLADGLAADIRNGTLPAGSQLPTQRELAIEAGTTIGTVGRAYSLLRERGLVSQEVGRGTYVEPVSQVEITLSPKPGKTALLTKIGELEKQLAELRAMIEKF